MASSCPTPSCRAQCSPYICTAPTPVLTLNWGEAAYAATRGTAVGILGSQSGSGFWVTPRAVVTAWHVVQGMDSVVRVVVYQSAAPPLVLDAVVAYAIPVLDLAFLVVNPVTVTGLVVTPTIGKLGMDAATGQPVFALMTTGSVSGTSFVAGVIRDNSSNPENYLSDLLTTVPIVAGAAGAPVFRATDYAIVGMVQYGTEVGSSSFSGGVDARLLSAGVYWAIQNCPALNAGYVLGVSLTPLLGNSVALGQKVVSEAPVVAPATAPYAYVFMPEKGVDLETLELSVPATGATVYSPTFAIPCRIFKSAEATPKYEIQLYGKQTVVVLPNDASGAGVHLNVGYVSKSVPQAWVPGVPEAAGSPLVFVAGIAEITTIVLGEEDERTFRVRATPSSVDTVCGNITSAIRVFVSDLGMVTFTTDVAELAPTQVQVLQAIYDGVDGIAPVLTYAAPFASVAFADSPLDAYAVHDVLNNRIVIQWQGSSERGTPVCFQAILGVGPTASVTTNYDSGEVLFTYAPDQMLPGWSDGPWLTGTSLAGTRSDESGLEVRRVIKVPLPPVANQAIYFGLATLDSNAIVTPCIGTTAQPPPYIFSMHGEQVTSPVNPEKAITYGTVVMANTSTPTAPFFRYALLSNEVDFQGVEELTVVSVNGLSVGQEDLDSVSLPDALVQVGINGSVTSPFLVTPAFRTTGFGPQSALTPQQMSVLLGSATSMGVVGPTTRPVTVTSFQFTPGSTAAQQAGYGGVACFVPPSVVATGSEPLQTQLVTVSGSVTLTATRDFLTPETNLGLFVLSLAHTDSTQLTDDFLAIYPVTPPTTDLYSTLAISITPSETDTWTVNLVKRYGYSGVDAVVDSDTCDVGVPFTVNFTLSYPLIKYNPRVNTILIGRPPVPKFEPANDFGAPTPSLLVPGLVTFSSVVTAPRVVLATGSPTPNAYAVVTTPRSLSRPLVGTNPY
jgi:hypothetical protein